jgi:hypothetical protein
VIAPAALTDMILTRGIHRAPKGRTLAASEASGSVPSLVAVRHDSRGLNLTRTGPMRPRSQTVSSQATTVELTVVAAILATCLFVAMAAFQATLAAGAPLGAHVLGGRHPGTLPSRLRVFSGIAAVLLVGFALVILARAAVIGWPAGIAGMLVPATWLIVGFLVLNTLGNLASKSRFERTGLAATTALLAVLCGLVALTA